MDILKQKNEKQQLSKKDYNTTAKDRQSSIQFDVFGRTDQQPWSVLKLKNNIIYAYNSANDELFELKPRKAREGEESDNKGNARINGCLAYRFTRQFPHGWQKIEKLAKTHDWFIIPNYIPLNPDGDNSIGKDFVESASSIFFECDEDSIDEQWEKINAISAKYGLEPSLVIFSGGKSLHTYFKLTEAITDFSIWERLQQKLIFCFSSDPAISRANREMRLAEVERPSKNSFQSLEYHSDHAYSLEEIEAKLDAIIADRLGEGCHYSEERYRLFTSINWHRSRNRDVSSDRAYKTPDNKLHLEAKRLQLLDRACNDKTEATADDVLAYSWEEIESIHREYSKARKCKEQKRHEVLNDTGFSSLSEYFVANYAESYNANGRGTFATCKCPLRHHANDQEEANKSADSLHINKENGGLKCWAGCESELIEEWLRDRARENGDSLADAKFIEKTKLQYQQRKSFTPNKKINQEYLDPSVIDYQKQEHIFAINSQLGSGKTSILAKIIADLGGSWLAIGSRNTLLIQSSRRWGMKHLNSFVSKGGNLEKELTSGEGKFTLCADSVWKIPDEQCYGHNIILDEVSSFIKHIIFAKTEIRNRWEECINKIKLILKNAKRIFLTDGLMSDDDVSLIADFAGIRESNIVKVKNENKKAYDISFLDGYQENYPFLQNENYSIKDDTNLEDKLNKNDFSELVTEMVRHIRNNEPFSFCSDSKALIEALSHIFEALGGNGLALHRDNADEHKQKLFIDNPDEYIKHHKPDFIGYSPTLEAGGDVSIRNYFVAQYCFFGGYSIDIDSCHQMIFRLRDENINRYVWAAQFNNSRMYQLSKNWQENINGQNELNELEILELFNSGEADQETIMQFIRDKAKLHQNNPLDRRYAQIKAIWGYEQKAFAECLENSLLRAGHNVDHIFSLSSDKDIIKDAKDEVKQVKADRVYYAPDIDHEGYDQLKDKAVRECVDACDKYRIKDELPNIEKFKFQGRDCLNEALIYDYLFSKPSQDGLKRLWLLLNPEFGKILKGKHWEKLQSGERSKYENDNSYLKVQKLREIGLLDLIQNSGSMFHIDSPEVTKILEQCKGKRFYRLFGKTVTDKTYKLAFLRSLLEYVGCQIEKSSTDKIINSEGKEVSRRWYKIINPTVVGGDPDYYNLRILWDFTAYKQLLICQSILKAKKSTKTTETLLQKVDAEIAKSPVNTERQPDQNLPYYYKENGKFWSDDTEGNAPSLISRIRDLFRKLDDRAMEAVEVAMRLGGESTIAVREALKRVETIEDVGGGYYRDICEF